MSLPTSKRTYNATKSLCTASILPSAIDVKNLPEKRKPFSSIWATKWCHSIHLVIPAQLADAFTKDETYSAPSIRYAKVFMSLYDIVEGEFFNYYIKAGNVMMLSEGPSAVDRNLGEYQASLHEGILRIEMDSATYERAGLQGKKVSDGQAKHAKNRFVVELELRSPTMVRGKKAFDRIIWTFKTILNASMVWVFCNMKLLSGKGVEPIEKHHPTWRQSEVIIHEVAKVRIPDLSASTTLVAMENRDVEETFLADLEDWIGLVAVQSPRVFSMDKVDPFICRYQIPCIGNGPIEDEDAHALGNLVVASWHGFLPARLAQEIWVRATKASRGDQWAAVLLSSLDKNKGAVTALKLTNTDGLKTPEHAVVWEPV